MRRIRTLAATIVTCAALFACSDTNDTSAPDASLVVLSLAPPNAANGVDPSRPIVITFSHAMMQGMDALVVLHEGTVTAPLIAGVASWSADRTVLTFTPAAPLKARTTYVLHLAPTLRAWNGERLNRAACERLGAQTVTPGMMGPRGGMMNGQWGLGNGWRAADGTFGMIFTFTTA